MIRHRRPFWLGPRTRLGVFLMLLTLALLAAAWFGLAYFLVHILYVWALTGHKLLLGLACVFGIMSSSEILRQMDRGAVRLIYYIRLLELEGTIR